MITGEGRGMEGRGMEGRGMEGRGMEGRGMEGRGVEGRRRTTFINLCLKQLTIMQKMYILLEYIAVRNHFKEQTVEGQA